MNKNETSSSSQSRETDEELVALLQSLIQIPSWVPEEPDLKTIHNENKVVDFLENWLQTHTDFEILRQPLEGGRFNLIAKKGRPDLIFLAHTDTVKPSQNAPYDQLAAEIHDECIWGRGATDMKSGVATMIQALSLSPDVDNMWVMLYADEEYDFLGMKALVEKYGDLRPKLIVSSDGSDLQLGNACRGLIEIRARVSGETGHPARGTGRNAIWEGFEVLSHLKDNLQKSKHEVMGFNSFSIAYMLGGAREPDSIGKNGQLSTVGQAGNVVPDIMEFVLDIRPAFPEVDQQSVIDFLTAEFRQKKLPFEVVTKKHDLGPWYTQKSEISDFTDIADAYLPPDTPVYKNPDDGGYVDLQMFWEAVGKPPAFMYGGGIGVSAHKPDERIPITNLIKERDFFLAVLSLYMSKNLPADNKME